MTRRPPRLLDTLSPSARKNKELFENVPVTAVLKTNVSSRWHGRRCGDCVDFDFCKRHKNAKPDVNYCLLTDRNWRPA